MSLKPAEKVVLIDGNSLLYRAFYALPLLQNRSGEYTNAVYGFITMLHKLLEEEQPEYLAVAFDPPKPSFRMRIDETYKAKREKTPFELSEQFRKINDILVAMQVAIYEIDDYEADDVIGTLADRFAAAGRSVTIVTGDADLLQLIGEQITVLLTKKGISRVERYDCDRLKLDYGLSPQQIIDFKALKGDPSDNIAGVPGIGDKTARNLLAEFGSIDCLYANLDSLSAKTAHNLETYREQLYRGRDLVALRRNIPIALDFEQCRYREPDYENLLNIYERLEFKSLINRLGVSRKPAGRQNEETEADCYAVTEIDSAEVFRDLIARVEPGSDVAFYFELHEGQPYWRQPLKTVALAFDHQAGYFVEPARLNLSLSDLLANLSQLQEGKIRLLVHNSKSFAHLFLGQKLPIPDRIFDSQLAAYLADPAGSSYELYDLLHKYLGFTTGCVLDRKKKNYDPRNYSRLAAEMVRQLFPLRETLLELLNEQQLTVLLEDLELPLAGVLARMERRGLKVDTIFLENLAVEISRRLKDLEEKIYAMAGEPFNINSPQQLAAILFDRLKLPAVRRTKTGRSTDARVLEELAEQHQIVALLISYRQLAKLESTYLSGLADFIDPQEQKIFTSFNQASTATGRLSSSEPNLQNIPIRLEEGRRIRRAFIPSKPGRVFFAADYSQVELRILAHLSGDPILVEAFRTGQDIHRRTAAEVNGISLEEVTPLMREKAKAVNFGIIYGSSDYGLSQGLKISRAEAKEYIDGYFDRYRGVKRYMEQVIGLAREQGFVTTILNRRRYLPEINSANYNTRSFAERMALNTPIQGSAADIIKLAMVKIDRIIGEGGFSASMLLQIHDELLFEIDENELNFFAPLVCREMEQAYTLLVPLKVDLKWGLNWEELKRI